MRHKGSVHGEGLGTAKQSNAPRKKRTPKKQLKAEAEEAVRTVGVIMGAGGLGGMEHHHGLGGHGGFDPTGGMDDVHGLGGGYALDLGVGGEMGGDGGLGGGPEGPFGEFDK